MAAQLTDWGAAVAACTARRVAEQGCRNEITADLLALENLDLRGEWSDQHLASARALVAHMDQLLRLLEAERMRKDRT